MMNNTLLTQISFNMNNNNTLSNNFESQTDNSSYISNYYKNKKLNKNAKNFPKYSIKSMKLINIIKMPIDYEDENTLKAIYYRILNLTDYPYYYVEYKKASLPSYLKHNEFIFRIKKMRKEVIIEIYKNKELKVIKQDITFEITKDFKGKLDPYQKEGVNWILNRLANSRGCILADDMGLGKTIQIIATILYLKNDSVVNNENKAIILVPKALIKHWFDEFMRFAPTLNVHIYKSEKHLPNCDVIIFSHNQAYINYETINKLNIHTLVIDEAHRVKTPTALITICFKKLNYKKVILATGTPFENSIRDGLCLLDFIYYKLYKNIINNLEKNSFKWEHVSLIVECFKSSILRRVKSKEIIPNLPNKIIKDIKCELSSSQLENYQIYASLDLTYKEIFKKVGGPLIVILKNICNDTSHLQKDSIEDAENSKIVNLLKIYSAIPNKEKLIVVSQYKTTLDDIHLKLTSIGITNVFQFDGSLSPKERNEVITKFKQSENKEILLLSLKAGGVGLNLQEASHVIMYDLWWNRTAETQAIDRAFRRGQIKDVIVYRFITNVGLEKSIFAFTKEKQRKIDLIWQAIKYSLDNLSFKKQNEFYSFIQILQFKSSSITHISQSKFSTSDKKHNMLFLQNKSNKYTNDDDDDDDDDDYNEFLEDFENQ